MRELLKIMKEKLQSGEDLVLVSVVASDGAAPRGAGARMLISKDGRLCGTIGGGAVEYRSQQIAGDVLKEKTSLEHNFSLNRNDVQNLGMICGGAVHVYFHYIPAGDLNAISVAMAAEEGYLEGKDLWLVTDISEGGSLSLADKSDRALAGHLTRHPHQIKETGRNLYIEQIASSGKVYLFGCGHVAQELEPVLTHVGFRCICMDDRPEWAKPELFPTAEAVKLIDFERILDFISITDRDYVCVMTRGHASDTVIQAQVLPCHPAYCGVIGSRHKAAGVRKVLREDYGISEADLNQVITPIGLDIAAETPAEIAISIAAQMIQIRAGSRS